MNWASFASGFGAGFGLFVVASGSVSYYVMKHPRILFRYMSRNQVSNKQRKRIA